MLINKEISSLPSTVGRKIILKSVLPPGGITCNTKENTIYKKLNNKKHWITFIWDNLCRGRGRGRAEQMWNGVHTYPSVKGRHVKMSAGCKHREQRDWELWAGISDIYGFSSWQPHRPAEWQIHMLKSQILHYRLPNHIHVTVKNTTIVKLKSWSKWPICQGLLCLYEHSCRESITLFKRRSFIYVFRLKRLTLTVHASLKHHNENGSVLQHLSKDESKCHSKPHTSIKRLELTFQSWF